MNDKDNPLQITWCNRLWIPHLNQHNVLNYFADKNNPFYDHTCNNEHLRMRGLNTRELERMKGVEYILLQAQEPILYVIRKQQRHSPTMVVPLANYYIIAGVIYQAPDLKSILESKLLTTIHCLQSAFDECFSYARFHPSVDYSWSFDRDPISSSSVTSSTSNNSKDGYDSASNFGQSDSKKDLAQRREMLITDASDSMRAKYRQSVDALIRDLYFKFPPPEQKQLSIQQSSQNNQNQQQNNENNQNGLNQQPQNGTSKPSDNSKQQQNSSSLPISIKTETEDQDSTFDQRGSSSWKSSSTITTGGNKSTGNSYSMGLSSASKKPKLN